mgnify:CR=1 FL=1
MKFEVGDLVRSANAFDKTHQLGVIAEIKEKVHLKSSGTAAIVMVYWFETQETDWEYTFFLEKLDK